MNLGIPPRHNLQHIAARAVGVDRVLDSNGEAERLNEQAGQCIYDVLGRA